MLKRIIPLAVSAGALLALAAPAAQATGPLITNSNGEAAKTITASSGNAVTHTAGGTLACTTVNLDVSLTENADTTARGHGTITAAGDPKVPTHTGTCGAGTLSLTVTTVTITDIHLARHGGETTGSTSFSYTYDLRSSTGSLVAECTFGGAVPVKKTGADTINLNGEVTKTGGSAFCPTQGAVTGDFTLRDELGLPATIH